MLNERDQDVALEVGWRWGGGGEGGREGGERGEGGRGRRGGRE